MISRRSFLSLLAAVPVVGRFVPKEQPLAPERSMFQGCTFRSAPAGLARIGDEQLVVFDANEFWVKVSPTEDRHA